MYTEHWNKRPKKTTAERKSAFNGRLGFGCGWAAA